MKFEVEFFTTSSGRTPVETFLNTLDSKMRAKAISAIQLLNEYGNELREPNSKYIGDGIFELRVKHSNNQVRILYFFFVGQKIILTNGFIKKTNKTPTGEISTAKKYRDEYFRRS